MRRRSFISTTTRIARDLERRAAARQREIAREQQAMERAQALREKLRVLAGKEAQRLYVEQRNAEAAQLSEDAKQRIESLESALAASLMRNSEVDLNSLRQKYDLPEFDDGPWQSTTSKPQREHFLPPPLRLGAALVPGSKRRYAERVAAAGKLFDQALVAYIDQQDKLNKEADIARKNYEAKCSEVKPV